MPSLSELSKFVVGSRRYLVVSNPKEIPTYFNVPNVLRFVDQSYLLLIGIVKTEKSVICHTIPMKASPLSLILPVLLVQSPPLIVRA